MNIHSAGKTDISRPLPVFACGFMAALVLLCFFLESMSFYLLCIFAALASTAFLIRYEFRFARYVAVILVGAAAASCLWFINFNFVYSEAVGYAGKGGEMLCRVEDYPQVSDDYTRADLKVEKFRGQDVRHIKARVYINGAHPELEPGDVISVDAVLELPRNTVRFASRRYLNSQGIYFTASAKAFELLENENPSLLARIRRLPKMIDTKLRSLMPQDQAGLMTALIFGDEGSLPEGFDEDLRITGLSHMTAVSGMNVAFFVGIILSLFGRRKGTILAIPAVFIFIAMTGAHASVVRAGIMQLIWLASCFVYREADRLTSLFISALIILIINPFSIADVGFQLSFLATLGMILYSRPIYDLLLSCVRLRAPLALRIVRGVASVIAATLSAQVFAITVQALTFGELSIISPVANILVLWASELAFTFGIITAALGYIWLPFGVIPGRIAGLLCGYILRMTPLLADVPFASVCSDSIYIYILIAVLYTVLILKYATNFNRSGPIAVCFLLLFICAVCFSTAQHNMTSSAAVISTGTGQSTVLRQGDSFFVFGAGGSGEYSVSTVNDHLREEGCRKIDVLAAGSYRSADIGSIRYFMENCKIGEIWLPMPQDASENEIYSSVLNSADKYGYALKCIRSDDSIELDGMTVNIYVNHSDDPDNFRLILDADVSGRRILALGAVQPENLGKILSSAGGAQAELMAVGDHYSGKALPGCAAKLRPKNAVLSSYGEAGTAILSDLADIGSEAVILDDLGIYSIHFMKTD